MPPELATRTQNVRIPPGRLVELRRGQYRFSSVVEYDTEHMGEPIAPMSVRDTLVAVPVDEGMPGGEYKRIWIYKLDRVPISSGKASVTGVIRVLDNPLLLAAVVGAVVATLGGVLVYTGVDKVESFAEKSLTVLEYAAIGATIAAAVVLFRG